jgi:hypothetical protein
MSDEPKHDGDPLRLALGMLVWAAIFYVFITPHGRYARDPFTPTWMLFYPFIGALLGLAIEVIYRLIGK